MSDLSVMYIGNLLSCFRSFLGNTVKSICAVITGGLAPKKPLVEAALAYCNRIIAADSGYDRALEWNVEVDEVVGDFDSMAKGEDSLRARGIKTVRHPVDKDYSDTELALYRSRDLGDSRRILFGGGGGRLDHLLSIIGMFSRSISPDLWLSSDSEILPARKGLLRLDGLRDRLISIMPISPPPFYVYSNGLRWELQDADWKELGCSLSNIGRSDRIEIEVFQGEFLIVLPYAADDVVRAPSIIESWR